jgi:hypothetical protein
MTLASLRALALAATPGPWEHSLLGSAEMFSALNFVLPNVAGVRGYNNAAYIAALSPERVLQLLDVIEAAKAYFGQGDELEAEAAFHEALAKLEGMK